MDREMMLEKDLWLRAFVDEALKAIDASLQKNQDEAKKKEAA
ncbi:MAG: hypothetical protein ACM3NT_11330 [Methylocystaceae bacterium]